MKISIKFIDYDSTDYNECLKIRNKILREPLGLKITPEEKIEDRKRINICVFEEDKVIGTGQLVLLNDKYQLRQVAIKKKYQNKGVGSQLVKFCEAYAKRVNITEIFCNAREEAINFYIKNGFSTKGEPFKYQTIPHILMLKLIA